MKQAPALTPSAGYTPEAPTELSILNIKGKSSVLDANMSVYTQTLKSTHGSVNLWLRWRDWPPISLYPVFKNSGQQKQARTKLSTFNSDLKTFLWPLYFASDPTSKERAKAPIINYWCLYNDFESLQVLYLGRGAQSDLVLGQQQSRQPEKRFRTKVRAQKFLWSWLYL